MNCKNCGFPLTNDVKTCPSCGSPNENYVEKEVVETPIDSTPKETSLDEIFSTNTTTVTPEPMPVYTEPKKKSPVLIIILIVVGVIIVGLGVFFAIYFLGDKPNTPTTPTVTPSKPTTNTGGDKKPTTESDVKIYVVFDDMTTDEIVDNMFNLADITTGESAYDFTDRFILPETDHILLKKDHVFGSNPQWGFSSYSKNGYIAQVMLKNVVEAEDGTITVSKGAYADPYIHISDDEAAEEIYKALHAKMEAMGNVVNEREHEKGKSTEIDINGTHYMLGLYRYSNFCQIHIQIPINEQL